MHNWDDFRYFLAVANCGSFSMAAKALGVNHSTVSRRIQVLEERHGVRLLDRTPTGYQMTEAGASIYDIVQTIQDNELKASRVLLGQDSRLEGNIKLTMPHDLFESCLAAPVKQFCHQHPAIELSLLVSHGLKNLANREADIAVRLTPNPPDYLVGTCITQMQHGIYAHTSQSHLKTTPIIVWGQEPELPEWALTHFHKPFIALRVDDLASMHRAVQAGFGVARMPCFFPDAVQAADVKRLPIELPRSDWGVWLLSHADLRNTARIQRCRQFLTTALTDLIPTFEGKHSRY
ncbi:LysR family transcriptional regulator [Ketobacter alkanivorans]|nr:LysR family transcriptional regulator [Ketobacter alkanivorans]